MNGKDFFQRITDGSFLSDRKENHCFCLMPSVPAEHHYFYFYFSISNSYPPSLIYNVINLTKHKSFARLFKGGGVEGRSPNQIKLMTLLFEGEVGEADRGSKTHPRHSLSVVTGVIVSYSVLLFVPRNKEKTPIKNPLQASPFMVDSRVQSHTPSLP